MSKTKRFDIESGAPKGGATFQGNGTPININKAPSQTKRKANFGIGDGDPTGITWEPDKSHISFPKANGAKLMANKAEYTSGGQGHYSPPSNQLASGSSFAGRPGIGGSSPKRGNMKPMKAFKV